MRKLVIALLTPIALAALLAFLAPPHRGDMMDRRLNLHYLRVDSVDELEANFDAMGYSWPPEEVPAIALQTFPEDLADITDAKRRKALFFRALLPIVLAENGVIETMRNQVIALFSRGVDNLGSAELSWLETVAEQYQVKGDLSSPRVQQQLLGRIDIVPPALVLAQAANESGWGTSRFALAGNNIFGQYTYEEADGIVPLSRRDGDTHALRAFESLDDSVRSYIHNLNTNHAYAELRNLRYQMRSKGGPFNSHQLATCLEDYSERGEDYVEDIQSMIRSNRLPKVLQGVSLAD